ncbi:hypothetical protein B0T25DRAFT_561796 [Lasiosphaeria hispida]|uniref:Uncharacterized protein n=1 Tax=Lasiosphaeria hispida TaxID=260671 RepID=A0AAJ0MJF5_9PEZI|nr:hypothetical protein B0T25DRAFT_561796 [Lasiosphaeria hispida]
MPTFSTASPTPTDFSHGTENSSGNVSGIGSNRTLIITLSSVLSVVGLLLIVGTLLLCWRFRQRRLRLFTRGISPIDDDEIATWKVPRNEKVGLPGGDTDVEGEAAGAAVVAPAVVSRGRQSGDGPSHVKHESTSSVKKPPSVIVYSNASGQGVYRHSSDNDSPRSVAHSVAAPAEGHSRGMSLDKVLPQTPIQARAPNARAGLTDESVPGDEPFLPSPKRHTSRLSKVPPGLSSSQRRAHVRTRSSRSSTRSFADYASGGSELELSQRHSNDYIPRSSHHNIYSSSSIPPRLSFSDESVFSGGLSPRSLLHGQEEIGRAIG